MADRTPYASYAALLLDVQRFAQKPHIVRKLANLKPGRPQSMLLTNDEPAAQEHAPDSTEERLLRMEKNAYHHAFKNYQRTSEIK